jgi:hypothetical protein
LDAGSRRASTGGLVIIQLSVSILPEKQVNGSLTIVNGKGPTLMYWRNWVSAWAVAQADTQFRTSEHHM